jgi:ribosomal protein S6--L-glutamate ligase
MNNRGRVRIGFLLQRSGLGNGMPCFSSLTNEIIDHLVDRDVLADLIVPEDRLLDIAHVRPQHDLYVLQSETPLALSLAGALTVSGAVVVNSFRSCNLTRDKIAATALLAAAGVPMPPSWATGRRELLQPLLADGPIWLKPRSGRGDTGERRVVGPYDFEGQDAVTDIYGLPVPIFTQQEVPTDGLNLKVFVAGSHVWALRRPFPAHTLQEKIGTPVSLAPEIQAAALKCGKVLGLELYGVDFLAADGRFYAVDVKAFPGYKGAAGAPWTLANFLYRRALFARNGFDG